MFALKQRNEEEEPRPILYQDYLDKKKKEVMTEEVEEGNKEKDEKIDFKELLFKYAPIIVVMVVVLILAIMIFAPNSNDSASKKLIVEKDAAIAASNVESEAVRTDIGKVLRDTVESKMSSSEEASIQEETVNNHVAETDVNTEGEASIDTSASAYTTERVIEVINGIDGKDGSTGTTGATGATGASGAQGASGASGATGKDGRDGVAGQAGAAGKSAYQSAVEAGYVGTEEEFSKMLSSIGVKIEDLDGKVNTVNGLIESIGQKQLEIEGNVTTINSNIDTLNQSINGFKFGVDENGNPGYIKAGADTVTPFKRPIQKILLGTGNTGTVRTFNATTYEGYQNFTVDNFFLVALDYATYSPQTYVEYNTSAGVSPITPTYNASTGIYNVPVRWAYNWIDQRDGYNTQRSWSVNYAIYLVY